MNAGSSPNTTLTGTLTTVQSRSRQVAGSPSTQPQRRNTRTSRLVGLVDRDR